MSASFSISLEDANTVSWVFGAVAIALTIGRYAIRWQIIRKFHADDLAHLAAVLFMIAELACYTGLIPIINDMFAWEAGTGPEMPDRFVAGEELSSIEHCLFISSLWAVKLAFMLFYRYLFKVSKPFNIAWWSVLGWNFVTYAICMLSTLWFCGGDPKYIADYKICESAVSVPVLRNLYIVTYIAVITSDLAVMILPLSMLRSLRLRRGQKVGVGAIFSLSTITIIFETVRLAKSFTGGGQLNVLWIHLEEIFAVIASALPAYYSLFNWSRDYYYQKRSSTFSGYGTGDSPGRFSAMPGNIAVNHEVSITMLSDEKRLNAPHNAPHSQFSNMHPLRNGSDGGSVADYQRGLAAVPREDV